MSIEFEKDSCNIDNRIPPTIPFKKSTIAKKKDLDKIGPKLLNSFFGSFL
mgnify:CR=1 FL=1